MKPQAVVGVRELRARLSAYLRTVAQGGTVTIGDRRRRPVARLVPVERSPDDEVLDQLASRGIVRRGNGKPRIRPRVRLRGRGPLASEIVTADRR